MGWRYTRKSRRRDTQKLPLMTHGNAAGAIVRYWPPHSATSYVASSYVYGSTCDTIVPFSMRNMLQCAWSGPLVRCAVHWSVQPCGPGHLPEAKRYCFHCKNKFLCAALHYETPGLFMLHSSSLHQQWPTPSVPSPSRYRPSFRTVVVLWTLH